jgi:hypothetical protein
LENLGRLIGLFNKNTPKTRGRKPIQHKKL